MTDMPHGEKFGRLQALLSGYGKLAVAYSGGVDSVFLLQAAAKTLGAENVLALTVRAENFPASEFRDAEVEVEVLFPAGLRNRGEVCQHPVELRAFADALEGFPCPAVNGERDGMQLRPRQRADAVENGRRHGHAVCKKTETAGVDAWQQFVECLRNQRLAVAEENRLLRAGGNGGDFVVEGRGNVAEGEGVLVAGTHDAIDVAAVRHLNLEAYGGDGRLRLAERPEGRTGGVATCEPRSVSKKRVHSS